MTQVADWVREIVEEVGGGSPFAIGDVVETVSGRKVKITNGQYWGTYGVSNHWYWREVLPDGGLGPEEYGYGLVGDDGKLEDKQ